MSTDIFEFWSEVSFGEKIHPRDRKVLSRIQRRFDPQTSIDLRCLPACFMGPLRTAPIVLLYLSPGWHESDVRDAKTRKTRDYYYKRWKGDQPLPGPTDQYRAWLWWSKRTVAFGDWEQLRSKVAILNIGAYHSKGFSDWPLLAALPSSRVSLEWAQTVLFPEAEAGERIVICLRAARFWGLADKKKYGKALFAPAVTRGGFMVRKGAMRREIIEAVRARVALTPI
jgi:hypothetical protein